MVVAVLADAPTLTTGFARTTRHLVAALTRCGHRVACFGLKARTSDVVSTASGCQLWPAAGEGHWTDTLAEFFRAVRPSVLLLNMDAYNAVECVEVCRAAGWSGPIVSYACFDGLPVGRRYLDNLRSCDAVWATSNTGADYLRRNGVTVGGVAPPGVDPRVFRPPPYLARLRERLGLAGATVVGVFATNTERKQVARVLAAFPALLEEMGERDVHLYLHCRRDGFWQLDELAAELCITEHVLFAGPRTFDEQRGVPTSSTSRMPLFPPSLGAGAVLLRGLSYVDRMSCCDVIVNVPNCGDVEQVILEAQSCGVPLVHTDDHGVMAATLGAGGLSLAAHDVGIGRAGQQLHHVAPGDIAAAVVSLVRDAALRSDLRAAGFANVAAYGWEALEGAACAMVAGYDAKPSRVLHSHVQRGETHDAAPR
jgi:glycosyltransferase involved in cell wall biosynthesis